MRGKRTVISLSAIAMCLFAFIAWAPTSEECTDAWNESDASNSCGGNNYGEGNPEIYSGGSCGVRGYCSGTIQDEEGSYQGWVYNFFTASSSDPISDFKNLKNCNGKLKVSSC